MGSRRGGRRIGRAAADAFAGAAAGGAAGASRSGSGRRSLAGCRARTRRRRRGCRRSVGVRWFREGGGMPSVTLAPLSGRYLSFAEREEIALLRAQGCGVREIARQLGRSPSTISRELRRNAATRGGGLEYRAIDRAVACRPARPASEAGEARRQRRAAAVCAGPPVRGWCSGLTGARWTVPTVAWIGRRHGRARTGVGRRRGARSRSLTGCASTSPMMSRCVSRTRRSTSRCTCRAAARCGAS